jgi:hypothetical protein
MVVTAPPNAAIEVRLRKLTSSNKNPSYFDEYAPLSQRDKASGLRIARYIVPEDIRYAIELVFKKGFDHGKFLGGSYWFDVSEKSSGRTLMPTFLAWDFEEKPLVEDKIFCYKVLQRALVEGQVRKNAELSFHSLTRYTLVIYILSLHPY